MGILDEIAEDLGLTAEDGPDGPKVDDTLNAIGGYKVAIFRKPSVGDPPWIWALWSFDDPDGKRPLGMGREVDPFDCLDALKEEMRKHQR